jgi:hypothetical protein
MIPSNEQLRKMSLRQLERLLERPSEGSAAWAAISPFYRNRAAQEQRMKAWLFFADSGEGEH